MKSDPFKFTAYELATRQDLPTTLFACVGEDRDEAVRLSDFIGGIRSICKHRQLAVTRSEQKGRFRIERVDGWNCIPKELCYQSSRK